MGYPVPDLISRVRQFRWAAIDSADLYNSSRSAGSEKSGSQASVKGREMPRLPVSQLLTSIVTSSARGLSGLSIAIAIGRKP